MCFPLPRGGAKWYHPGMERTLRVLNELERDGVLGRYAIGGAMGATFYVEPLLTFDLDIFVVLPENAGGLLTLGSLYQALNARGYAADGDCVMVEGVPVQFLPAYNPLLEEALADARPTTYGEMEVLDGTLTPEVDRLLRSKADRRRRLARLPYPEKVRMVVRLQEMAAPLARAKGREVRVWPSSAV